MLPAALAPFAAAIDVIVLVRGSTGWRLRECADVAPASVTAAVRAIPAPAHWDGSPPAAVCVRLDVSSPALSSAPREQHRSSIGSDGALYVFENGSRSQHANRTAALARLAALVA